MSVCPFVVVYLCAVFTFSLFKVIRQEINNNNKARAVYYQQQTYLNCTPTTFSSAMWLLLSGLLVGGWLAGSVCLSAVKAEGRRGAYCICRSFVLPLYCVFPFYIMALHYFILLVCSLLLLFLCVNIQFSTVKCTSSFDPSGVSLDFWTSVCV